MMRILLFTLLSLPMCSWAQDFTFSLSNPMMSAAGNTGDLTIGSIDPFNPSAHCLNFIAPNDCSVSGNHIAWTIVYNYQLDLNVPGTVDVSFVENNGVGTDGAFTIVSQPPNLTGLTNGSNGSISYVLTFPYFSNHLRYSMEVSVDITLIP